MIDNCGCNMPTCLDCYMDFYHYAKDMGCRDKEWLWDYQDIIAALSADEYAENFLSDSDYEAKDSW